MRRPIRLPQIARTNDVSEERGGGAGGIEQATLMNQLKINQIESTHATVTNPARVVIYECCMRSSSQRKTPHHIGVIWRTVTAAINYEEFIIPR